MQSSLAAALQAHRDGRDGDAEALYLALIEATSPERVTAQALLGLLYHDQGNRLYALGRSDEAVTRYDAALALSAQRADGWNNRGAALEDLGRLDEAVDSFSRALALEPGYVNARVNRGGVYTALGRWTEALADFDQAREMDAAFCDQDLRYWTNRGIALHGLKRFGEASDAFAKALDLDPAHVDALANLSVAQRQLGQVEAALASADRAVEMRPDHPETLTTRGLALAELGRFEDALESHERALALRPDFLEALNNAGVALDALDRTDEALARFDRALALNPDFAEAEFGSALAMLYAGRYGEGWRRHEARWRRKGEPGPTYPVETLWLGRPDDPPLQGRTILLHAEQGLGDTLQFCRYAPLVKPLGPRVILEVQPALKRLLAGLSGVDQVIGVAEPVPPFDLNTPILSLPLALGCGSDIPPPPDLILEPTRAAFWRTRLPSSPGLRLGLVWAGNSAHGNDRNRSLPASALAPLIAVARRAGAQMISLQKDPRPDDRAWLDKTPDLSPLGDQCADFADTAAVVAACDLVISVDTSVAHLAGTLGRPLWLLLPTRCDWRWMSKRQDTPWYPSARLFRQARPGDWAEVIDRAARALAELASA